MTATTVPEGRSRRPDRPDAPGGRLRRQRRPRQHRGSPGDPLRRRRNGHGSVLRRRRRTTPYHHRRNRRTGFARFRDHRGHNNAGTDGTDTLRNIERLVFSDTVAPSHAPVSTRRDRRQCSRQRSTSRRQQAAGPPSFHPGCQRRPAPRSALSGRHRGRHQPGRHRTGERTAGPLPGQATNAIGSSTSRHCPSRSLLSAPVFAGAPAIGTATAGNAQATVRWTAPAAVANATAVTQYRVRIFVGTGTTADPRSDGGERHEHRGRPG